VLKQFHCEWIHYAFEIPRESFDLRSFSRKTGIKIGERWNAGVYPSSASTGYHVHFKGIIEKELVHITVEYWDGAFSAQEDPDAPTAEAIMAWIGSFVRETNLRAMVLVRFEKPTSQWRSRFNLPFKVTMSNNLEVTIDGVSIVFPKNDFRAFHAFLNRTEKVLEANVGFARSVQFSDFDVAREIVSFNEAVNMFAEQVV
jgi:hypothetical protein